MNTLFDLRKNVDLNSYIKISQQYKGDLSVYDFQKKKIIPCIGCWDCWLKTPGNCALKDRMNESYSAFVASDAVIILMDTAQGFINHKGKAFIDRSIPHFHPYIKLIDGESQHLSRYDRLPDMIFYFEREGLSKDEEQRIEDYLYRTAYHFKTIGYRIEDLQNPTLKRLDFRPAKRGIPFFGATNNIDRLVIYNGSPRIKGSNTGLILQEVQHHLGNSVEVRDLKQRKRWRDWQRSFSMEEHILLMLPLYVHSMPSHVMEFIEGLKPSQGSITFFIQSGFPESSQSYYLEAYFEQLAKRLQRIYLGTVIKGGVEGLKARPIESRRKAIEPMVDIIQNLISNGELNKEQCLQLGKPVRLGIVGKAFLKTGIINYYWDQQLKANNAFSRRDHRPYL